MCITASRPKTSGDFRQCSTHSVRMQAFSDQGAKGRQGDGQSPAEGPGSFKCRRRHFHSKRKPLLDTLGQKKFNFVLPCLTLFAGVFTLFLPSWNFVCALFEPAAAPMAQQGGVRTSW